MTHEFLQIITSHKIAVSKKIKTVLATIVLVEGSSYRKEGTRMLIDQNGLATGAISGGCVEQEVIRQAQSVFVSGCPKVFKYDGRYRLGCEGSIYVLIESFNPSEKLLSEIENAIQNRKKIFISCRFTKDEIASPDFGTSYYFEKTEILPKAQTEMIFCQEIEALNRLCIFGVEHDAEKLSQIASFLGWEVIIIASEQSNLNPSDFPFAKTVLAIKPEDIQADLFCKNTAVVVMSHNFAKDLRFLSSIITLNINYIGLLGPAHRKEKLLNAILETDLTIADSAFDKTYGPVGLPIGSQTPEEIALSIMAEIVRVFKGA